MKRKTQSMKKRIEQLEREVVRLESMIGFNQQDIARMLTTIAIAALRKKA